MQLFLGKKQWKSCLLQKTDEKEKDKKKKKKKQKETKKYKKKPNDNEEKKKKKKKKKIPVEKRKKIRLFPTMKQREILNKWFGTARWTMYNNNANQCLHGIEKEKINTQNQKRILERKISKFRKL